MNNKMVKFITFGLFGLIGIVGILRISGVLVVGKKIDITQIFHEQKTKVQSANQLNTELEEKEECPNDICAMEDVITEEQCDSALGIRNEGLAKCIDTEKQNKKSTVNLEKSKCYKQGGIYEVGAGGVGLCVIVPSESDKDCFSAKDCISQLCQVSNSTDKKGKCNVDNPFKGCGKFLSFDKKVVRICQ